MSILKEQEKFIDAVFRFMTKHDIPIRSMAKMAGVSTATFYRSVDKEKPVELRRSTMQKLEKAMKAYDRAFRLPASCKL